MDTGGRLAPRNAIAMPIVVDEADAEHVYTPRKPQIPPQWVPIGEYHALVERVRSLEACLAGALEVQHSTLDLLDTLTSRVIDLEKRLADQGGN